jgi:membrane peptidoglycan carboxypeptidase
LRETLYARREPGVQSIWMPLWSMADTLQTAVVVWEDPAFFHHGPINPQEIARAVWLNLRAGNYVRGASTITQQVVKNQFLSPEKSLRRKVREVILAYRLEQALTKQQILTAYLNIADWGEGVAGAEAASRKYFGKPAASLDWAEAALLAGMLPNPRARNPCVNPVQAVQARNQVLAKLHEYGHLTEIDSTRAQAAALPSCATR